MSDILTVAREVLAEEHPHPWPPIARLAQAVIDLSAALPIVDDALRTIAFCTPVVCYEHEDRRYVDIEQVYSLKRVAANARAALAKGPTK